MDDGTSGNIIVYGTRKNSALNGTLYLSNMHAVHTFGDAMHIATHHRRDRAAASDGSAVAA